jgi:phage terminase small subunit
MAAVPRPLGNPRHELFVRAYTRSLNATQAAVEAGYAKPSARKRGWRLMRRPEVRSAIVALQEQRLADENVSAVRVLEELRRLSLADVRSLYRADGTIKNINEWTEEMGSAVQEVTVQLGPGGSRVLKVRFCDKTKALEMLAKHLKLLVEQHEVSGGLTITWLPPERDRGEVIDAEPVKALPPPVDPER